MESPHFLFTFSFSSSFFRRLQYFPCVNLACYAPTWSLPPPHPEENLSINVELQGFSPAGVRSSHFILLHHCVLSRAVPASTEPSLFWLILLVSPSLWVKQLLRSTKVLDILDPSSSLHSPVQRDQMWKTAYSKRNRAKTDHWVPISNFLPHLTLPSINEKLFKMSEGKTGCYV